MRLGFMLLCILCVIGATAQAQNAMPKGQASTQLPNPVLSAENAFERLHGSSPENSAALLRALINTLQPPLRTSQSFTKAVTEIALRGGTIAPDSGVDEPLAAIVDTAGTLPVLCLIQFYDEVTLRDLLALYEAGATTYRSGVKNAIVATIGANDVSVVASVPAVRWIGKYEVHYKYSPARRQRILNHPGELFHIFLFRDDVPGFRDSLIAIGVAVLNYDSPSRSYKVRMQPDQFDNVIALGFVEEVYPFEEVSTQVDTNPDNELNFQADDSREFVNADLVWQEGNTAQSTRVGVIDTGIDDTHVDFPAGSIGHADAELLAGDGAGHGTHVSGIIGSRGSLDIPGQYDGRGVASGCQLWVYDFQDDFAGNLTALDNANVRVVNNSWGARGGYSYSANSRIADGRVDDQGMTIVFAAGNDGVGGASTVISPGTGKNVITVGSVSFTLSGSAAIGERSPFSSQGPTDDDGRLKPEVVAPGGVSRVTALADHLFGVASCKAAGITGAPDWFEEQTYWTMSGTSQAAPHVAGIAALFHQQYDGQVFQSADGLCPRDFTAHLVANAVPLEGYGDNQDAEVGFANNETGFGLADALYTVFDVPDDGRTLLWGHGGLVRFVAESQEWDVTVPGTPERVVFVLCYEDQEGETATNEALWDDLDMEILEGGAGGTRLATWKDWVQQSATVTTEGPLEKIVDDSPSETYRIDIRASSWHDIFGSQRYTVLVVAQYGDPLLFVSNTTTDITVATDQAFSLPCNIWNTGGLSASGVTARVSGSMVDDFDGHKHVFVGNIAGSINAKACNIQLTAPSAPGE